MEIEFDLAKLDATLRRRGLDFAHASMVFSGESFTSNGKLGPDREERFVTFGYLDGRAVVVVWTWRGKVCRIMSMRHAHRKEIRNAAMGRS